MLPQLGLCSLRKHILQRKIGWNDEFKRHMCFSHGTTSCRVTVRYFATKTFKKKDIKCDKNERPLLLDAKIDDQN